MTQKPTAAKHASSLRNIGNLEQPKTIPALLANVDALLQQGEPKKAFDLIARTKIASPWAKNAAGVCHLRLGNAQAAVDLYRGLVLGAGGILLRSDAPVEFKINFAIALLEAGNLSGCESVLGEIREPHPTTAKVRGAIRNWKASLTIRERLGRILGIEPRRRVQFDFPLGELAAPPT